jgi:branched-chain amino acid transport system ATP-binding protein
MEILRVEGLTKKFGDFKAVDNVSFNVKEFEILSIIGPNGAGKTTLINLITKKLKPDSGKIFFYDKDVTGLTPRMITKLGISRTFQIVSPYPTLTVYENVLVSALQFNTTRSRLEDIMVDLGLEKYKDVKVRYLPSGIQKLLELAMALAQQPKLLILDEPAAGLLLHERRKIVEFLKSLEKKVTIIVIEHDMEVVFDLARRIIVMDKGRIIADGSPEEVANNRIVREIYLGEA